MAGAGFATIFALASGAGRAAVAVLRLSGSGAAAVLSGLAGGLPVPRMATLRRLRHPRSNETLDHALVLWFPGPRSYTGEDAAELHLHGGPAVIAAVADALLAAGARPAEPGEFTRRAFVHGKLDLTAAEGIADLIAAETTGQRRQALRQAGGALAGLYAGWSDRLARILARQEAFIEFEDEELPAGLDARVAREVATLKAAMLAHLAEGGRAQRLRDGVRVAIVGAPNVGKSSLLNTLAGRDAAIVSAQAGTTRDVVEVVLDLGGVRVVLADTAGLRLSGDAVEAEGVRRARQRAAEADVVLAVFAAGSEADAETLALVDARTLVVVNKSDLAPAGEADLAVSALTGQGIAALESRLSAMVARLAGLTDEAAMTRPRHRAALTEAADWLDSAVAAPLPELRAEALRAALRALGRITGQIGVEAVLDQVFAEFCIGK